MAHRVRNDYSHVVSNKHEWNSIVLFIKNNEEILLDFTLQEQPENMVVTSKNSGIALSNDDIFNITFYIQ